jgi:hypothetical protein
VEQEQIYTHLLERWLADAGKKVEVINTGVGGYGSDQVLLFLMLKGFDYHPDMVIHQVCADDIARNVRNVVEGEYLKPRFVLDSAGQLELQDYPVPPPYRNARTLYWLASHSRLAYFLKHRIHLLRFRQGSANPPQPETASQNNTVDQAFRIYCALNNRINEECIRRGIPYMVLMDFEPSPSRRAFWDASCVDVKTFFINDYLMEKEKAAGLAAYIPHDGHWSSEGQRWVAEYLFHMLNLAGAGQNLSLLPGKGQGEHAPAVPIVQ